MIDTLVSSVKENISLANSSIKSFVTHRCRMTPGQKRGFDIGGRLYTLSLEDGILHYEKVFKRSARLTLEIGFGMGSSLLEMALKAPQEDFIGIEVYKPGVGSLLNGLMSKQLSNIRVYNHDAVEVLKKCFPMNSLDQILILFPDPWHKVRHHKRRLIQPVFLDILRCRLKIGGILHLATDCTSYAKHMLETIRSNTDYSNISENDSYYQPTLSERPITKFEKRAKDAGDTIWELKFRRII